MPKTKNVAGNNFEFIVKRPNRTRSFGLCSAEAFTRVCDFTLLCTVLSGQWRVLNFNTFQGIYEPRAPNTEPTAFPMRCVRLPRNTWCCGCGHRRGCGRPEAGPKGLRGRESALLPILACVTRHASSVLKRPEGINHKAFPRS